SSGDRLMAHFQETATEGRFTAQVPTEFGEKPISGDTKLQVKGGDAVTATYVDALDATRRANVSREYRAKVNGGGTATLRFLDSVILPGEPARIEVSDTDLDVKPGPGNDQVSVTITSSAGDRVTATLMETSTAGVFEADVPTQLKGTATTGD